MCAERTLRTALITFTFSGDWETDAPGQMRDFWQAVRNTWLGTRYFCWAELTAKGALHYHAIWVNPPHMNRVNLIAWVKRHWPHGRTQVSWPRDRRSIEAPADYVKKYVFKMGKKSYQQRYEVLPSSIRTFMSQRLEIPPKHLVDHLDRDLWRYVPTNQVQLEERRGFTERQSWDFSLVCIGHVTHAVPPGARCSALDFRRQKRRPRWHTRPKEKPRKFGASHQATAYVS